MPWEHGHGSSSQSHPNDISAVFCFLTGSFETSIFSVFSGFWLSLEQCLGELSSASHHHVCSGVSQLLPFPIKQEVTGMLFTPKVGQLLLGVPFPWGLTQTPHYCLPNTQRHQAHRAFPAMNLELTPTPSILVQCLISGHNVWKLRFLHEVSVQWEGNSAVLLVLRYWKLNMGNISHGS